LEKFSEVPVPILPGVTIRNLLTKSEVKASQVDSFDLRNVLSAGVGQNPAKQSTKAGGLPDSTFCTLINQVCSSSLKALLMGFKELKLEIQE
jgi:acetyl-CoA C-acetyltransferase